MVQPTTPAESVAQSLNTAIVEARYQKFRRIAQLEQALQTGAEAVAEPAETAEKLAEDEAPGLIPEGQEGVPPRRTPGSPRGRRL